MSEQLNQFNSDTDSWIGDQTEDQSVLKDNIVNLFKRAAAMAPALLKSYPGYAPGKVLSAKESGDFEWVEVTGTAPAETVTISNAALSNNNTITITASSANTSKAIEYSLNGSSGWQSNNIFTNVANGTYNSITARLIGSTITDVWGSSIVVNYTPNVTPAAPTVTANDTTNTLSASHDLGDSEILVSENNGSYVAYSGAISVGDVTRSAGYWKFKIKSAAGRNESSVANSPAFTALPTFNTTVNPGETSSDGVGLTIPEGTGNFKYNSPLPAGDAFPAGMYIYIGGVLVALVDFITPGIGQSCSFTYNGTTYYTTFINGDRNL